MALGEDEGAAVWEPDPGWTRLAAPRASTAGVFLVDHGGSRAVVKRLVAPTAVRAADADGRPDPALDPGHWAYWRREAEVAAAGVVATTCGLRTPALLDRTEDADGVTLVWEWVPAADDVTPADRAHALGRFAAEQVPVTGWTSRPSLDARVRARERARGWPELASSPVAGVAAMLWHQRDRLLASYAGLPAVASHGDAILANVRAEAEPGTLVAVDWSALGHHPVGSDLGTLLLSVRDPLGPLVDAYRAGASGGGLVLREDHVVHGAAVVAAYTLLTRTAHAMGGPEEERAVAEALRFEGLLEALVDV